MPQLPLGDISVAEIYYDYGGAGQVKLSPFLGEILMRREDSVAKVYEEGQGNAAVDAVFAGAEVMELDVPMTRNTLAQLEAILPGHNLTGAALLGSNKCGSDMYANAKEMVIIPMKDGVLQAKAAWVKIFMCHPYNAWEIGWSRDKQKVFLVKFLIFPNQDSGHWGEFYTIGVNP